MDCVACQAPLSMEFSRQDWSGLPFPFLGDPLNPGIEPGRYRKAAEQGHKDAIEHLEELKKKSSPEAAEERI